MYENIKTLEDVDFNGKKVLLRVDYNVPLDAKGNILDDFRIRASIPTIKTILKKGASQIIIMTHFGRPKNKESVFKTDILSQKLHIFLGRSVEKLDDCIDLEHVFPSPEESKLVMLENLRFSELEILNDDGFAKKLAKHADIYVNDAFGVCHRKHASVHAITKYIPGCVGLLVEKELKIFTEILSNPQRPFTGILGGAKLETKIPVIKNLIDKVDNLLIGGGMIFTFYSAMGYYVGRSMVDKSNESLAKMLLNNEKLVVPEDVVIADDMANPSQIINSSPDKIPSYMLGLDIGEKALANFKNILDSSKTVIWNGPLGYYENPLFAKTTNELLEFLANSSAKVIIGGGDTAAIVEKLGLKDKFHHVSTGGGASMMLLEGSVLPAIKALKDNN